MTTEIKSQSEMISKIKELLATLSESVLLVMAYLFSFLHQLVIFFIKDPFAKFYRLNNSKIYMNNYFV